MVATIQRAFLSPSLRVLMVGQSASLPRAKKPLRGHAMSAAAPAPEDMFKSRFPAIFRASITSMLLSGLCRSALGRLASTTRKQMKNQISKMSVFISKVLK